MRAVSKDYEIARVMGVDIDKIISITFIIGSSLAAIGAIMWGIRYPGITPMMGVMPGLKCFIAFAFIVLIVILFYKPTGLLGEKTTEKV